ncbi:hypothetical protein TNCV_4526081 [Trichonephila clavipes]|nr:hypothetical protein TNCV_4526081 [Trichonephila clavipes]
MVHPNLRYPTRFWIFWDLLRNSLKPLLSTYAGFYAVGCGIITSPYGGTPNSLRNAGIVPSRHGGTLNSRRASNPFVRLVEKEERWEAPDHPQGVLPQNWGETELNRPVTCMVLKSYG